MWSAFIIVKNNNTLWYIYIERERERETCHSHTASSRVTHIITTPRVRQQQTQRKKERKKERKEYIWKGYMCSTTCQLQASNYFKLERGRMEIPLPLFPSSFLCLTRLRSVNADDWRSNAMDVVVPCIAPSSGRLGGLLQKANFVDTAIHNQAIQTTQKKRRRRRRDANYCH